MIASLHDDWPPLSPLDDLETPDIPASILPNPIGPYAKALASAAEVPEALVVMTILGMVSTALTKCFIISPSPGWNEPINIYIMIAMPPGSNKSLTLKACGAPLIEWEEQQRMILEPEQKTLLSNYETERRIIDGLRRKAASSKTSEADRSRLKTEIADRDAALEEPSPLPELFATDTTPEALASTVYEQNGRYYPIENY